MADIKTKIHEDIDLTIHKITGALTVEEACDELDRYYAAGRFTMRILWELTGADISSWQREHITRLIYKVKEYSHLREGGKTALVLSRDLDFGISRMYQAYAAGERLEFEIEVFRDMEKAKEWLGVPVIPGE